ncbi:hypothetical protein SJAV_21320 [Sulfurisphaera javensis]|uniref:Uncharacterized protein n=1 Tax=Sulfurisphaera javensis TaxID=2049879 RepID=A0AAT9GTH9_9CREN
MKSLILILAILFLLFSAEVVNSMTLSIVSTNEEIIPTSIVWYNNAVYIAYNIYNVTSDTSTFYVVKIEGNEPLILLKQQVPYKYAFFNSYLYVINGKLYIETVTFSRELFVNFKETTTIYIYNGTGITELQPIKGFYYVYPLNYDNHHGIVYANISGPFIGKYIVEINSKNISFSTNILPPLFSKDGIIVIDALSNKHIFQPIGPIQLANYSIVLYGWNGSIVWNRTYTLSLSHIQFVPLIFDNVTWDLALNNTLYIINATRSVFPVEGEILKINLMNGEVEEAYSLQAVNGSIVGLLDFDNEPVLITESHNFIYIYTIINGVKLAFKIPLYIKTVKVTKPQKINGKIENVTTNETVMLDRVFFNNRYILIENLSNHEVTVYTLSQSYHYKTSYNFSYIVPAEIVLGYFANDAYYIPNVLLGSYGNKTFFILLNKLGNVTRTVELNNTKTPLEVLFTKNSNVYYVVYLGKQGLNTTLNFVEISSSTTTTAPPSLTTPTAPSSSFPVLYVGIAIVVVLLIVIMLMLKKRK